MPQETIGYVTGRERSTMNRMEEDTDTLMFFLGRLVIIIWWMVGRGFDPWRVHFYCLQESLRYFAVGLSSSVRQRETY